MSSTLQRALPLVFEIGVEEIPSQYLEGIGRELFVAVGRQFQSARLDVEDLTWGATPRRLVVLGRVAEQQVAQWDEIKGPSVAVAFRDGRPTPAAMGFARRVGLDLSRIATKGEGPEAHLVARVEKPIQMAMDILPSLLEEAFTQIPLPRSMRWGDNDTRFIRPVRWCLALLGDRTLSLKIADVESANITYGNRTDHPGQLEVVHADEYAKVLEAGMVMLQPDDRAAVIKTQGQILAQQMGGTVAWDDDLLREVANLVEWPTPFVGQFDQIFLEVPDPILITSMKVHQRYFPVVDGHGQLLPTFVGVRNGEGQDLAQVRRGNEKVLRARLSDAAYFYAIDQQTRLADHRPRLDDMVFHAKLGTYGDKLRRVLTLFDKTLGWWRLSPVDEADFRRSVDLYKCDLLTQVVQEFPELQGVMGAVYAQKDGEAESVVLAIADQYHPGYPGDRIPDHQVAQLLGLLDRVDTVLMAVAVGLRPTGSEDPFGLRRYALAIGRLVMETALLGDHSLRQLMDVATRVWGVSEDAAEASFDLVRQRLENTLANEFPVEMVRAVMQVGPWHSIASRLDLIRRLRPEPQFDELLVAYKRMWRVLDGNLAVAEVPFPSSYRTAAESALADQISAIEQVDTDDWSQWWDQVLQSTVQVNNLFESVMILDQDPTVRTQRLQLLAKTCQVYRRYFGLEHLT